MFEIKKVKDKDNRYYGLYYVALSGNFSHDVRDRFVEWAKLFGLEVFEKYGWISAYPPGDYYVNRE